MDKVYNLSKLFEEGEFDTQKGCKHYGSKETYFSILHRFTLDSGRVLDTCNPENYAKGEVDIEKMTLCAVRLQRLLTSIGAIKLAWDIQKLTPLLDNRSYSEYWEKFREALVQVERLRERIISAEKTASEIEDEAKNIETDSIGKIPAKTQHSGSLRHEDFEKLLMLIDNFELDSAEKAVNLLMQCSYTEEIDKTLADVHSSLREFDFIKSLGEAQRLLELAANTQKNEKPPKKNILAIDDSPGALHTIDAMLRDVYNVYCMTDYDSAVKYLCSNTADLILLDIEMPGIDGFAMMQLFRGLPDNANTPILFLTGSVSDDHIRMAVRLGARDFIKKPVDLTVLRGKLENVLSQG